MQHSPDMVRETGAKGIETARHSDAPTSNPDKLILPEGLERQPTEIKSIQDVNPIDLLTDVQKAHLDDLKDKQIPRASRFEGDRGDSLCLPDASTPSGRVAEKWLAEHGLRGIEYKDGYPDFSHIAVESVSIPNMTNDKFRNFSQAYKALAEKWNSENHDGRSDWKPSEIKQWKTNNGLVIHEKEDLKTCEFVPIEPHSHFSHVGGRCIAGMLGRFVGSGAESLNNDRGGFDD